MFSRSGEEREREAMRLEGEIAEVCGLLNATTARLVALIAEVLVTGSWTGWGIRSPEHWVAWQCGVSARRAHNLVIMAQRLVELPAAQSAFNSGALSEDQVAVIARHAPVYNDAEITELARSATVSQLSRTLRSYPFTDPPAEAAGEPEPVEERRDVSFGPTHNGRWRLSADLPGDEGALVEASLAAHRDRLFRDAEDGDRVTWADALLAMADHPATPSDTRAQRDRTSVLIHLNTRPATPGTADTAASAVAHLHGGTALPDSLRRYLLCDTRARPVWETDGTAVNVGRARRTVPERTRIIIEERDRGCRTPGCPHTRWLHIHHITHWEDGGPTNTNNLACLCPHHHRLHHRGHLGITGNADDPSGLTFTDQHGRTLKPNSPPTPPGDPPHQTAPRLGIRPGSYHHPTGERLNSWSIEFTQPPPDPPPSSSAS